MFLEKMESSNTRTFILSGRVKASKAEITFVARSKRDLFNATQ